VSDPEQQEEAVDGVEESGASRRPEGSKGRRLLIVSAVVLSLGIALALVLNGSINAQARGAVETSCEAEARRISEAITTGSERSRLSVWMIDLYRARRIYVDELCAATTRRLGFFQPNFNGHIDVDMEGAARQEITTMVRRSGARCLDDVSELEEALLRGVEASGGDPQLWARVSTVVRGQRGACESLRQAIPNARIGYWPPLSAPSVSQTPAILERLLPGSGLEELEESEASGDDQ